VTRIDDASPRARARVNGAVYFLFFVTAVLSALLPPRIGGGPVGLPGDAAAVAGKIVANKGWYELGVVLGLFSTAFYVALAGLFYALFKPVSRILALLAAFFSLVGCAAAAVESLFQLAPLTVLGSSPYLSAFSAAQRRATALMFLNLGDEAGRVALIFFGCFQLLLGYLIIRSTFLPRAIGVLIALAGVGWLTFLSPPVVKHLSVELEILGFVAEVSLMLWLLVRGVDSQRWTQLANRTALPAVAEAASHAAVGRRGQKVAG
jgi:Domain of unknown function (DUF4386)